MIKSIEEALEIIVAEARRERSTKAGLKRLREAGGRLVLNGREQQHLEMILEYRDQSGNLYPRFEKK